MGVLLRVLDIVSPSGMFLLNRGLAREGEVLFFACPKKSAEFNFHAEFNFQVQL